MSSHGATHLESLLFEDADLLAADVGGALLAHIHSWMEGAQLTFNRARSLVPLALAFEPS